MLAEPITMIEKEIQPVYITVADAAKLLSVSERTIFRMIKDDRLDAYKIGRATRLKREDVLALPEREED